MKKLSITPVRETVSYVLGKFLDNGSSTTAAATAAHH